MAVADGAPLMREQGKYLIGKARDILTEDNLCPLYRAPLTRIGTTMMTKSCRESPSSLGMSTRP